MNYLISRKKEDVRLKPCYFFLRALLGLLLFWPQSVCALPTPPETDWDKMWEIQLINNDHMISQDVTMDFMYFDGQGVDARAGLYYAEMVKAAARDGITLYLRSGYRSIATQQYLYQTGIQRYMTYGYSYATAVSIAKRYYASPGGSEHHLGLAFDIITPEYHNTVYSLDERFASTAAYTWLLANCADFGFILRYPKGRTDVTGINFESWHYRYVGVEHAQYISEHGLVLEEYVTLYQETYPELYSDTPPIDAQPMEEMFPATQVAPIFSFDWEKIQRFQNALVQIFPGIPQVTPSLTGEVVSEDVEVALGEIPGVEEIFTDIQEEIPEHTVEMSENLRNGYDDYCDEVDWDNLPSELQGLGICC